MKISKIKEGKKENRKKINFYKNESKNYEYKIYLNNNIRIIVLFLGVIYIFLFICLTKGNEIIIATK